MIIIIDQVSPAQECLKNKNKTHIHACLVDKTAPHCGPLGYYVNIGNDETRKSKMHGSNMAVAQGCPHGLAL